MIPALHSMTPHPHGPTPHPPITSGLSRGPHEHLAEDQLSPLCLPQHLQCPSPSLTGLLEAWPLGRHGRVGERHAGSLQPLLTHPPHIKVWGGGDTMLVVSSIHGDTHMTILKKKVKGSTLISTIMSYWIHYSVLVPHAKAFNYKKDVTIYFTYTVTQMYHNPYTCCYTNVKHTHVPGLHTRNR